MALLYFIIGKFVVAFLFSGGLSTNIIDESNFDYGYHIAWGNNHVVNHESEVQLFLDQISGARFESKQIYGSGFFTMDMKLPPTDSAGVVISLYLVSDGGDTRDELDIEFLGNRERKPYTLQTNVFANGIGDREHRVKLWFDPSADFHTYKILWNQHHTVFYIDNIPIRYFKNNTRLGVNYPSKPMRIEASIWDGSSWATDGGKTKIDWKHAPFRAFFKGFNIDAACKIPNTEPCNSNMYWWNSEAHWELTPAEQRAYQHVKNKCVTYDYCNDRNRHPLPPPECPQQVNKN